MIVKNEQKRLPACLESIAPLATEIIVADTGSTDQSLEIARSFKKAKVIQIPWQSNFATARNATIEQAAEPWIFSFDADEIISAQDVPQFRSEILAADQNPKIEAISLVRRDYVTNPAISGFVPCRGDYPHEETDQPGYYTERMVRIFRNRPHIRWVGSLHEMVDSTLKGSVLSSSLVFHHYGYRPEEVAAKKKREFYEQAGHQKASENPTDWKAHYDIGIEYLSAGEFANAVVFLQRAVALKGPADVILSNLGFALMNLNRLTEAERVLRDCLQKFPNHHDSNLNLGVVLLRKRQYAEALSIFTNMIHFHPNSFLAHRNRGICFANLGDLQQATQSARKALELFPTYSEAETDLGVYLIQQHQIDVGMSYIQNVIARDPSHARALQITNALREGSLGPKRTPRP